MRLDFNVLWVEDQPNNVRSSAQTIDRLIRKHGFRLQHEFAKSVEEAKGFLSSSIYGDHIDLVIMDYDLGAGAGGPTGEDGLAAVRHTFPYKDIVFYSAQAQNLAGIVAKQELQGVYCSDRTGLHDVVYGVFESLTKKVLDIDHARGIIMGSSSDIDGLVMDGLFAHFGDSEGKLSDDAKAFIQARVAEVKLRFEETCVALEKAVLLSELHKQHLVYSSVDRLHLLRKLLEKQRIHAESCKALKKYANTTMPKRNVLAHVRVKQEGFSRKLIHHDQKEFTADEMQQLLVDMLEHQEAMETLLTAMGSSKK